MFVYIYVLVYPQWPSHPQAFLGVYVSFTVCFTTKLLFLQHKLTDISSIYFKKVCYFCNISKCDHKLRKDAQLLPLFCDHKYYTPQKQWHTYIIQNSCSYFVLLSNTKSLFLLHFNPGSKNTTRTLHKICIKVFNKIKHLQEMCRKCAFFTCVLCWGMPSLLHRKRKVKA